MGLAHPGEKFKKAHHKEQGKPVKHRVTEQAEYFLRTTHNELNPHEKLQLVVDARTLCGKLSGIVRGCKGTRAYQA